VQSLKSEIEQVAASENDTHDWINKFRSCTDAPTLERRIVAELIEKVTVYEGNRIEVTFRYYNEFARLQGAAKKGVA
jgi:hypothetical protein